MSEIKDPSIFQIAQSLLASFFGVQSQENMDRDEKYIEKKGIKVYIIMGLSGTLFVAQLVRHCESSASFRTVKSYKLPLIIPP